MPSGTLKVFASLPKYFTYFFILSVCTVYGLLFSMNWKIGLALLFFLIGLIAIFYSLELGILLVFSTIPLDRLGKITPDSSITFAKILIGLLVVAWLVRVLLTKDYKPITMLKESPLFILSLLFVAFSLFSVINARELGIFLSFNIRRISCIALFFLIINIVNRTDFLIRILGVILLVYVGVGFIGLYEIQSGESILKTIWGEKDVALAYTLNSGSFRIGGPGGDPDFLAISVIFPTLIAVLFLYMTESKFLKILLVLFVLLMLTNMIGTGSRGGLGSLMIGAAVFWFFAKMRWKYITLFLGLVLLTGVIVVSSVLSSSMPTERYTGGGGESILYRIGWSQMAFSMIKDHPVVGVGTGNFPMEYNKYSRTVPEVPREPFWTHNSFLQCWAENGIFGFLVYSSLFFVAAKMMLTVIKNSRDQTLKNLALMLLSVLTAYFFFAGTSNILENENYWIVFALITVVYHLFKKNESSRNVERYNNLQDRPHLSS